MFQELGTAYDFTHVDLFSGIGGFALAAKWNGFKTVAFCEREPYAQRVLRKHWNDVPIHDDVRTFPGAKYEGATLLTGGFPCQPFSLAGKRAGAEDDRFLWPAMVAVIEAVRPTWIIGENVPGIINMELDRCLVDLENAGYTCWPVVIPACAVDARHRRDRVWIMGYSESARIQGNRTSRQQVAQSHAGAVLPLRSSSDVADAANCGNVWWDRKLGAVEEEHNTRGSAEDGSGQWWAVEPDVGRVAHGVPSRVDRLRGLGNAIVPQVAAEIMSMIAQVTKKHNVAAEPPREAGTNSSRLDGPQGGPKDGASESGAAATMGRRRRPINKEEL